MNRLCHVLAWLAVDLTVCACDARLTSLGAQLKPDAAVSTGQYIEAEAGELSGFTSQPDAAASGGGCIEPPAMLSSDDTPGAARATYHFQIANADTVRIWGRIRGPDAQHNRFWFQLDDGAWHKWRISTGEIWFWDALHEDDDYQHPLDFSLSSGAHQLVFANCVDGVALDRLYVTADGDTPPGNDTPCQPPDSIPIDGTCHPSCGSWGTTTCGVQACDGKQALSAYDCDVCCLLTP
jgi:hypothetical protein